MRKDVGLTPTRANDLFYFLFFVFLLSVDRQIGSAERLQKNE